MKTGVLKVPEPSCYVSLIILSLLIGCVGAGLIGSSAALAKDLTHSSVISFSSTGLAALAVFIAGSRYAMHSVFWIGEIGYVSTLIAAWVITRGSIALACLRWPLLGDEDYLHSFVGLLVTDGITSQNLARLSTWYDYPVWLSRASPIYYPLRVLFLEGDTAAVRIANVCMGAATLFFLYLLAKQLIGQRYARCVAFLHFISPFQFFDVVSYTPQIPGTLMVTVINWLILRNIRIKELQLRRIILTGFAIGVLLFAVRIQRGGFDLLILAGYPILLALYAIASRRTLKDLMPSLAIAGVAFLVWAPPVYYFDSWVQTHDSHHLRSHALGFMVRGSNPVSLGEYLGRYERLDAVSAPEEKSRVQWSVLATESAREPLITLGALPLIKAVKMFAIGHASAALSSSDQAGYARLSNILRASTDVYEPFLIILCLCGLVVAVLDPRLGSRVIPVCWFGLSAGLAIIGALGLGGFREHRWRTLISRARRVIPRLTLIMTGVVVTWVVLAGSIYWISVHATGHLFRDMRGVEASINGVTIPVRPLNRWTRSWEQEIVVPQGTNVPAKLRLKWRNSPPVSAVRMSIWTESGRADSPCGLVVADRGQTGSYSTAELVNMKRGEWTALDSNPGAAIEIALVPRNGVVTPTLNQEFAIAVGYAF